MYVDSEQKLENATLRERLFMRRHQSGLPVYFCPRPGFKRRYTCFATDFGAVDSAFRLAGADEPHTVPDGTAHFLEHKLFEQPDGTNASDAFSLIGASSNAYTSAATTNYLFSSSQHYYEALRLLIDFVQTPHFTDDNVEKEKGIIGEEISMYDDHPSWRQYYGLLRAMYHHHPLRISILGTADSIAQITKGTLYDSYHTFYHPENMVLFAIGDLDKDEYFDFVDGVLSTRDYPPRPAVERVRPDEPTSIHEREYVDTMVVSLPRVHLGFKERHPEVRGRAAFVREQATDILHEILFGRGSAFFERHYASQLIDEGFGGYY